MDPEHSIETFLEQQDSDFPTWKIPILTEECFFQSDDCESEWLHVENFGDSFDDQSYFSSSSDVDEGCGDSTTICGRHVPLHNAVSFFLICTARTSCWTQLDR